jgi:hypothetical protein
MAIILKNGDLRRRAELRRPTRRSASEATALRAA